MRKILLLLLLAATFASAANITIQAPVKSVTVYSNGFAFLTRAGTFSSPGGSQTLHIINFTGSAAQYSIIPRLSAGRVSEFYTYSMEWNESTNSTEYFALERLLNDSTGRTVSFSIGNETFSGRLIWFNEGRFGIQSSSGISVYNIEDLRQITLPTTNFSEVKQTNETKEEHGLSIGVRDASGSTSLNVSYIASGASWDASYKYYLSSEAENGSGTLQGWATVTNNAGEDWENSSLRLVVGNPHIQQVYTPFQYAYATASEARGTAGAVPSAAPDFTASQVSAYYVYTLQSPATIKNGEERSLPLLEKTIGYKREYFWDTSDTNPQKVFILNNTGSESWASGVASVYLNSEFLGEAGIDYTPRNVEARVSVANLPDIKAEKETLNQTSTTDGTSSRTTYYKMRLTIENTMNEDVKLRINDWMYYGDEIKLVSSTTPVQVKPGNILEWNPTIRRGGSLEITYEYTVTDYYITRY